MPLSAFYLGHLNRARNEMHWFWPRLGGRPSFEGMKVLDMGCGLGPLAIDAAERGAAWVTGIDIERPSVDFANELIPEKHPGIKDRIRFLCIPIADLKEDGFDLIVSKDALEHIHSLEDVFREMINRLKPGGHMYLGFGPLWYSMLGGHAINRVVSPIGRFPIPWGHILFPESFIVSRLNRVRDDKVSSIEEYGLNKRPYVDYERMIQGSGLKVLYYSVNPTTDPIGRVLSPLSRFPVIGEYFTRTVYCILQKA